MDSVEGLKTPKSFRPGKGAGKGHEGGLVVVNKVNRPAARVDLVMDMVVFDRFVDLGASDEQTDFRVIYASGLLGKAGDEPPTNKPRAWDRFLVSTPRLSKRPSQTHCKPLSEKLITIPAMGIARITNGSVKANDDEKRKGKNAKKNNY